MNWRRIGLGCMVLAAMLVVVAPESVSAQQRRRSGGGEPPARLPDAASLPRFPYAGTWRGTLTMRGGPAHEIGMVFELADSAKSVYTGATLFPNSARSPHLQTISMNGVLQWEEKNSGPGFFVYSARFTSPDSIAGTVGLRDSNFPEPQTGTFVLARRRSSAGAAR